MPSVPCILTVSGSAGTSRVYQPDYMVRPFNLSIGNVLTSTSTQAAYTVDFSNDDPVTLGASQMTWFSSVTSASAGSSNTFMNISFPVRAIRLDVTTNSSVGSIASTIVQSG